MAKPITKKPRVKVEYPEVLYDLKKSEGISWQLIKFDLKDGQIVNKTVLHEDLWPIVKKKHFDLIYPR